MIDPTPEETLRVAQIASDTDAEGPGRRFALWVQGCTIRCPGCCNPEMFTARGGTEHSVEALASAVAAVPEIEGITLLGGEPFEQAAGCAAFARRVREAGRSVMVFTGYTLEDLQSRGDEAVDALLATTDLLVDGPYDATRPETERRWLGSTNQRYHFLTDRYRITEPRFWSQNTVEIRFDGRQLLVNGWPAGADQVFGRRRH